jgi:osmoprotectant transport system substrate-binding protein
MLAGEIDTYFEYNGTGWTVHLANEDPRFDAVELTNDVCVNDLEENSIRWVGVSPFNDTYGFATAADSPAAGVDLQGMMEYVNENADATVCMETEFPNRPDGLVLLEDATGLTIPEGQSEILDTGVIYDETASGNCTFGEVFTTDGRIQSLDLALMEDTDNAFISYLSAVQIANSFYEEHQDMAGVIADIGAPIDEARMTELNALVDVDGEFPEDVAAQYLQEEGFIE